MACAPTSFARVSCAPRWSTSRSRNRPRSSAFRSRSHQERDAEGYGRRGIHHGGGRGRNGGGLCGLRKQRVDRPVAGSEPRLVHAVSERAHSKLKSRCCDAKGTLRKGKATSAQRARAQFLPKMRWGGAPPTRRPPEI